MVFQKPYPFPKTIYGLIALGVKFNSFKGRKSHLEDLVEKTLRGAVLRD
jgi:phosphate transport system ATP-binding protein